MKLGKRTNKSLTQCQRTGLAMCLGLILDFTLEHKEEFHEWLKSKAMQTEVQENE